MTKQKRKDSIGEAEAGLAVAETAAGWIGLLFSPRGLMELHYPLPSRDQALASSRARLPEAPVLADTSWGGVKEQLRRYYAGQVVHFDVPFDLSRHTPFQRLVWDVTFGIPYGETRSYAWVAAEIGSPQAYRAVGSAMAANPIPIIIPCHRVLRSDGSLGGYGGGLTMKQRLLAMEKRVAVSSVEGIR